MWAGSYSPMAPKGWREFNEAALAQAVAIALKTVETAARLRNGWAKLPFPGGIGKWPDLCRKAQDASGRVKGGN
jgi:hypothetical protein